MSGGSLNYLYCKEPGDLFDRIDDLERAEACLLARGHKVVAMDVRRLIEYIRTAYNRIAVLHDDLAEVFRAVEWYMSADSSADAVDKAVEAYRRGG